MDGSKPREGSGAGIARAAFRKPGARRKKIATTRMNAAVAVRAALPVPGPAEGAKARTEAGDWSGLWAAGGTG
jgi:hypothetical protein